MKKNVGKMDRIVRIAIAVALSILAYSKIIPSDFALGVYIVSIIIALTGFIRFCPIYKILHKSTCREEPPHFS
ncbi:MAG: DUF2892 domain-containing protein [Bacteroidota bacterium]